jgi:hypothetical protein
MALWLWAYGTVYAARAGSWSGYSGGTSELFVQFA